MTKTKIYIPTNNSIQLGLGKTDKWALEFETENSDINRLMGWQTSSNTLSELNLKFAQKIWLLFMKKKNKINFEILELKKRKIIKRSYADNFLK